MNRCISEGLLHPGMKVIAGVSGGADSVCLLRMLKEMAGKLGLEIICVHIEHGIRGEESRRDMEFVRKLCSDLDILLKIYEEDVPARAAELSMTVEEAGRYIRYEAFEKEAERTGADAIAVAHHLGDQAETVLFNLIRGSGLKGVSGMAPGRGKIIRPLLNVTRMQIEGYLNDLGQDYCSDSTNADTAYSRNGIRRLVLPELERIVTGAAEHIARAAREIREADDFIRDEAARAREETVTAEKAVTEPVAADKTGPGGFKISRGTVYRVDIGKLIEKPAIIRRYIIRFVLTDIYSSHKDLETVHVEEVLDLADKQSGRSVMLPAGIMALREGDKIGIGYGKDLFPARTADEGTELEKEGITEVPGVGIFESRLEDYDGSEPPDELYTKWFDYDRISDVVLLRTRKAGDYLTIGSGEQHKKLKKYLVDEKVPVSARESLILMADGDHIMWVVGMRISSHYKITAETKRVLKVIYKNS